MKRIFAVSMVASCLVTGCINESFTEDKFLEETGKEGYEIALIERGSRLLGYKPDTWQLGFNDEKIEFRVHDDKMGYYYVLRCDAMPSEEGQTVNGRLEWTTYNDNKVRDLSFTVSKIDADGKIWLWNARNQIGVVVVAVR